jgi:hypothetical protein
MKSKLLSLILAPTLLCLLADNASSQSMSGAHLTCVDPLVKVFRGTTNLPLSEPVADVAVGEFATLQFVFRSPVGVSDLKATVSGRVPEAVVRFVGYVHVGKRQCNELWSDDGLFPDPLLEEASITVSAAENQPVWVTVPARRPGEMRGLLTLRWSGGEVRQPFTIRVHNVRIKKPRLWITNWWFDDAQRMAMMAGHKVEKYSDEYWRLLRKMADFMAQYHQNTTRISPLDLVRITGGKEKLEFDFSRFDRTVKTFIDAGVIGRIEGGHLAEPSCPTNRRSVLFVRVPELSDGRMRIVHLSVTNTAARQFYSQFIPALADHLEAKQWDKIYWQHLADEPTAENAASYRDIAAFIREFEPRMRFIEASQTRELVGAVNIWVPILDHLHRQYEFMQERQKAGDEVWTYTCMGPTGSYANRFMEQELIKPRLLHWINYRYGITGYLHWGFNYWNPETSPFKEYTFKWPAGDPYIVYPKNGRLLSSIRLEAMRDGICDHELLSMLAERDPAAAHKIAGETILDFNRYDTDIPRFRDRHLQILEMLEAKR